MAIEALEGKETNVSSRKGIFIPGITVEMLRNAPLAGVEELMASGEMEDISLPSAQPSSSCVHENDSISRQAAIREYQEICKGIKCGECPFFIKVNTEKGSHLITDCKLEAFLHDLPSAQPEVIRCTECKYYREYDSEYVENAVVVQCMADRYPISETIPDGWFCAGAERRTDE